MKRAKQPGTCWRCGANWQTGDAVAQWGAAADLVDAKCLGELLNETYLEWLRIEAAEGR